LVPSLNGQLAEMDIKRYDGAVLRSFAKTLSAESHVGLVSQTLDMKPSFTSLYICGSGGELLSISTLLLRTSLLAQAPKVILNYDFLNNQSTSLCLFLRAPVPNTRHYNTWVSFFPKRKPFSATAYVKGFQHLSTGTEQNTVVAAAGSRSGV
jgi:hypothetical protein